MMRIYFILLLLPFVSCGQANQEFNLQNSFQVNLQNSVCITNNDCFCFSSDSSLFHLIMHYSDAKCKKKKLIDTVEFSPYESRLHTFKSEKNTSYVILWETEYEYIPVILAYYVAGGNIVKISELEISLPCQSCESLDYPIKDIRVVQEKNEIEISFLKDVNYRSEGNNEWKLHKAGTLKYRFNTETNELRHITLSN
ncbi:MAG TPA: hypothetical protein VFV37_04165 [Luteibaculaceae bacterium]|nr:hypothetical protein [Luteibaculaceae bacterium]